MKDYRIILRGMAALLLVFGLAFIGCGGDDGGGGGAPTQYTVGFDAAGGAVTPLTVSVNAGGTVSVLPVPTKAGNTFNGWFTEPNGGGTPFTTTTPVNAHITVYANWVNGDGGEGGGGGGGGGGSTTALNGTWFDTDSGMVFSFGTDGRVYEFRGRIHEDTVVENNLEFIRGLGHDYRHNTGAGSLTTWPTGNDAAAIVYDAKIDGPTSPIASNPIAGFWVKTVGNSAIIISKAGSTVLTGTYDRYAFTLTPTSSTAGSVKIGTDDYEYLIEAGTASTATTVRLVFNGQPAGTFALATTGFPSFF